MALANGLVLLGLPRLWQLDDPFGDRARVCFLAGGAFLLGGIVTLAGTAGKGLAPRHLMGVGGALVLLGMLAASVFPKGLGGPMLPVWLGGLLLLAVGAVRQAQK